MLYVKFVRMLVPPYSSQQPRILIDLIMTTCIDIYVSNICVINDTQIQLN